VRDPLDLRGQDRDKADFEAEKRVQQKNEEDDFKWLMQSKRGRRIIWRLLEQAGVFRISFNQNSMTMAFNEGGRNYGLKILDLVHTLTPELYPTMLKEQNHVRDDGTADHSN